MKNKSIGIGALLIAGVLAQLSVRPAQAQSPQAMNVFGQIVLLMNKARYAYNPDGNPAPCRDPWVSSAFRLIFDRNPNGTGDSGECNYRNYGGGYWTSYSDLVWKVAQVRLDQQVPGWRIVAQYAGIRTRGGEVTPGLGGELGASFSAAVTEVTGKAPASTLDLKQFGLGYDAIKGRVEAVYYPCSDNEISKAINQVLERAPRGIENQGECNAMLYGKGKWKDYDDLTKKVTKTLVTSPFKIGECRDGELTRAISEVRKEMGMTDVKPSGMGELGECNSYLYGFGQWNSYGDLKAKVKTALTDLKNANIQLQPDNSIRAQHMERGGGNGALMALLAAANAYMQWKAAQPPKEKNNNNGMGGMQQPQMQQQQMQQPQMQQQQMQLPGMGMIQPGAQMPQMQMQPNTMMQPQMGMQQPQGGMTIPGMQ